MRSDDRERARSVLGRVRACDDGAIMVFGIFFAVVAVAMLYYMVGIGAAMYYRERIQDAADGSAFASAIVHARGMNTLALINVVMAALLAVLVALRLVEALIIIAEVILYALSWLGGATAAIASALEVVREAVDDVVEAAQPVIFNANKVLKVGAEVIRIATPIAANLSVLGKVAARYEPEVLAAIAIPPRITLPVEDDTFPYLCGKAGVIAGELALLPIKPILPGGLRSKLSKALGKLVAAGSSWFCDGSDPPEHDTEEQVNNFPASDEMQACTNRDKQNNNSVQVCQDAEKVEAAGQPDEKTGQCRQGQPLCPTVVDTESEPPGQVYQYSPHSYCGSEEGKKALVTPDDCLRVTAADGREFPANTTAYGKRLAKARVDCDPKNKGLYGHWWTERELAVTWEWNPATSAWTEVQATETSPSTAIGRPDADRKPCVEYTFKSVGIDGVERSSKVDGKWNESSDLRQPVCTIDEPKPAPPEPPAAASGATDKSAVSTSAAGPANADAPTRVVQKRVEVLQILGCSSKDAEGKKVVVGAVNLAADRYSDQVSDLSAKPGQTGGGYDNLSTKELGVDSSSSSSGADGASGGGDSENTVPYRFLKGHRLGTSDMQIRSLVVGAKLGSTKLRGETDTDATGSSVHEDAKRIVAMSKWRTTGDELTGVVTASEVWGRFAVAQAEYYFDVGVRPDDLAKWGSDWDEQDDEKSGRDFLWSMSWTARMRRFRLSWKVDGESADGPSKEEESKSDDGIIGKLELGDVVGGLGGQSSDDMASNGPKAACKLIKQEQICQQVSELMRSYDSIFIH